MRDPVLCQRVTDRPFDEVYQLAADMGGAGHIFTGEHDSEVMHNSAMINLNMVDICCRSRVKNVFYSSSACIYPAYNQTDPINPKCSEDSAYPAAPDSEYGWEKLFSERMYLAYHRNHGLEVRIATATQYYDSSELANLGAGFEIMIRELAEKIKELTGFKGKVVWDTTKPDGQPRRCLDTRRAKELFGFEAQVPFEEGLRRTINWWCECGLAGR